MENKKGIMEQPTSKPGEQKFYKWNPEDKFTFSGKEFSLLFNTLNQIVESPVFREDYLRAKQTMSIAQLHELMSQKLNTAVDFGVAKEISKDIHDEVVSGKLKVEDIPVEG